MRRILAPFAATLLAVAACSEPQPTTLSIDASPSSVNISPTAFSTITVTGTFDGNPLQDGSEILLETDFGSLGTTVEEGEQQSASVMVAGGKVSIKLYAPRNPATATVVAKFIDPYSKMVTATKTVTFKTASSVTKLSFTCRTKNIGAFIPGIGDFKVKCTAVAEDDSGEKVAAARIKFLTEAGELTLSDSEPDTYIYDPLAGGRKPKDVAPLGDDTTGEPRWVDTSAAGSPTRNPRDGLVTLVAYVEGESNGIYSTPFVDVNDDNSYNAGEDMPGGVAEFEEAQDKYLWKQQKVLWTGRTSEANGRGTRVTAAGNDTTPIERGASRVFTWTILDINLNVLAANSVEDAVSWEAPDMGEFSTPESVALANVFGIDMDANGKLRNPTKAESYGRNSTYSVTMTNSRTDEDGPTPVVITGTVSHNVSVDESGVATGQLEGTLPSATITLK